MNAYSLFRFVSHLICGLSLAKYAYAASENYQQSGQQPAERVIAVNLRKRPLMEALQTVAKSAGVALNVEDSAKTWLALRKPVTMRAESITLKMAVEMLIEGDDKRSVPIDYYLSRSTLNVFSHISLPTTQISASLNDATLDEALQQIFRQIEAPYVYTIRDSLKLRFSFKFKNLAFPMALYKTTSSVQSPKVCTFDTINDLLILYNSKGYISNPESLPASERYTVRAREADVRWVLKSLFGTAGYNFTLDQWIQGTISIDIRSPTLPEAVESILHKASDSFTYQVENNVYMVSAKVIPQGYRNPKPQVLHK